MKSGVYKITNTINEKCYIGSSKDIKYRLYTHKRMLIKGTHHSSYLQRAYNKRGAKNFTFETLFTCSEKDLLRLEQYCLDNYNLVYSIRRIASSNLGLKRSEETKRNISNSLMGRKLSDEHKRNCSLGLKGRIFSKEHCKKISEHRKGKLLSEEHKLKLRDSHLGYVVKEETKEKLRNHFKNRENTWQSRKVQQICKDSFKILQEFISVREASNKTGISQACIAKTARGLQVIGRGFIWKYI